MGKAIICAVMAALFTLTLSEAGWAQQARGRNPCLPDIAKYCERTSPGGGKIAACLKEHEAELSGECKDYLMDAKEKGREFAKNCRTDVTKLCKGVKPGGGRLIQCLNEHEAELSLSCKAYLSRTR